MLAGVRAAVATFGDPLTNTPANQTQGWTNREAAMGLHKQATGVPTPHCDFTHCSTFSLWKVGGSAGRGRRLITGKIKAPASEALLAGVRRLQLRGGREGKGMILCRLLRPITAPTGAPTSKNIRRPSWMSVLEVDWVLYRSPQIWAGVSEVSVTERSRV